MKKNILLSLVLLLACTGVNAANWQPVESQQPNVKILVDMDSIRKGNTDHDFVYAARYQVKNDPEKLIYLKTDTKTNQLGIIKAEDYENAEYRPVATLSNPRVFMKSFRNDFFLKPLHDYIIALSMNDELVNKYDGVYSVYNSKNNYVKTNYVNTNYTRENYAPTVEQPIAVDVTTENNPTVFRDEFINYTNSNNVPNEAVRDYLSLACKQINANWMPPQTETDKRVIINAAINKKGQLVSYDIVESSGDIRMDNSAVKALKDAQVYPQMPSGIGDSKAYAFIFRFVFESTKFGHTIIY